jgi:hypothetical protein
VGEDRALWGLFLRMPMGLRCPPLRWKGGLPSTRRGRGFCSLLDEVARVQREIDVALLIHFDGLRKIDQ